MIYALKPIVPFCLLLHLVLLIFTITAPIDAYSQKELPKLRAEPTAIDLKQSNAAGINGFKITAENPIEQVLIDSVHGIAYVVVNRGTLQKPKNDGYIVAHDLQSNKGLWSKPINLALGGIFLADSILICNDGSSSYAVDHHGPNEIWRKSFYVHTIDPTGDYALASGAKMASDVRKVEIKTGSEKWFYDTGAIGDLEKVTFYGDSVLLISANGIYYVPLDDGKGWKRKATTGSNTQHPASVNTARLGGALAAGILLSALSGGIYIIVPLPTGVSVGSKQDNFLIFDNHVYLIAIDKFYKFDHTGKVLFEMDNPFNSVSNPKLFEKNGAIYAAATGKGYSTDGIAIYSTAFVAKHIPGTYTWETVYEISKEKRDFVNDYLLTDSSITFACTNRMLELRLSDLSVIKEKSFGSQMMNIGLKDIVTPPGFIPTENGYLKTTDAMPGHIFIENTAKMKIEFDTDLAIVAVIPKKKYFANIDEHVGLRLIGNDSERDFIDSNNESVFNFKFSERVEFYGNIILDIRGNEVIWVELKTVN